MKVLIKVSGKVIDNENELKKFITAAKKYYSKDKVLIVHGGGKQVSRWSEKFGIKPKFVDGLRFTDESVLEVVVAVLCGVVNKRLVCEFLKNGIKTIGISCIDDKILDCVINKKLGFVGGKVKEVNDEIIKYLWDKGIWVVLSSVGLSGKKVVNINADDVAYALAEKLKVDKLIFLTDKEGVLDKEGKVIKELNVKDIDKLIKEGVVTEGMVAKLNSIKKAVLGGVKNIYVSNSLVSKGTVIRK